MIRPFRERYTIQVGRYEMQPTADGYGTRKVEVDCEDWEIEVEINLDSIVRYMGRRAVLNKGGKSSDGNVVVKRVRKLKK